MRRFKLEKQMADGETLNGVGRSPRQPEAAETKVCRKTPAGVFLLFSFAREARRTAPS